MTENKEHQAVINDCKPLEMKTKLEQLMLLIAELD